jgi:murein DD-endopeptidase MepM/ murein hydrolase activator NlpD
MLPDGQTAILFSRFGAVTFSGPVTNLSALPVETVSPNFSFNNPGFLQITLPSSIPTGNYLVFAALLQQGALANNQLVVLAADTKTFTVSTGPPNGALPILESPFTGPYSINSPFDHFYPTEFINTNGIIMYFWGEQLATAAWPESDPTKSFPLDVNHSGYDFNLPDGTPLFAAGDGTVVLAGSLGPAFCPLLNATIDSPHIRIDHVAPNGKHFVSVYAHVSRIEVQAGQKVVSGQPIGLSGHTGCSDYSHLHFQINTDTTFGVQTDPYGWEGSFADPWAARSDGVPSLWLWREGREPTVFREIDLAPNPSGSTARVTITAWRWMGVNDARNPNNEFVEITLDPRYATTPTFDMTGFILRNNNGDTFTFPAGFQMQVGRSVRVYTGPGISTDTELFWGLGAGAWDNTNDCARLVYPTGGSYFIRMTQVPCG